MSFYEHVFIMRQDLSNTQAEALIEEFSNILSANGGSVVDQAPPFKCKNVTTAPIAVNVANAGLKER